MNDFLNKTMVSTAEDIYSDDVAEICVKIYEIKQSIARYTVAKRKIKIKFVIFILDLVGKILNKGY
jgi:hypothetical protein